MIFYIASDHAGVLIKPEVISMLKSKGIDEIVDLGPYDNQRVDYPKYANLVCENVKKDPKSFGILICGTGIGMSLAANKHSCIRAALCHDAYTATMARAHNDANVLCFGQRVLGLGTIESIIDAWLSTKFEGNRHAQRITMFDSLGF